MFNVTVINLKEMIKYLVYLITIIFMVIGCARYFFYEEQQNHIRKISEKITGFTIEKSFVNCLDDVIPGIKKANNNLESSEIKIESNELSSEKIINKLFEVELTQYSINENIIADEEVKNDKDNSEKAVEIIEGENQMPVTTEVVTENPIIATSTDTYKNVKIKNETKYNLTQEMLEPNIEISNKNIIIFHTHTCESYTASEKYNYQPTGTYRTTDLNYTVAKVGDELTDYLNQYGFKVVHDKTYHDYPAYTGSYTRSLSTIKKIKETFDADIIIDLHRDAIGSNSNYAPTVKIGDEYAAQLMFVIRN